MPKFLPQALRTFATLCSLALLLASCGGSSDSPLIPDVAKTDSCSTAGIAASTASTYPTVCMLTNKGEIVFELYSDKAPITVGNYLKYVNANFYNNTVFHRAQKGYLIQGGGYDTNHQAKTALYPAIVLESNNGLSNLSGTIAMARTEAATSAQSQFFINLKNNTAFDYSASTAGENGYAVFGKVISGTATLTAIGNVSVDSYYQPKQDVVIYWAKALK